MSFCVIAPLADAYSILDNLKDKISEKQGHACPISNARIVTTVAASITAAFKDFFLYMPIMI